MSTTAPPVAVVGLGADGWDGLAPAARTAIADARLVIGARRHLDLVPAGATQAQRRPWPSPMRDLYDALPDLAAAGGLTILASGDPMLHGVGVTLAQRLGATRLRVHPHASAFQLACARLGWPVAGTTLVSAVARPIDVLAGVLQPGRRVVAYVTGSDGASQAAALLRDRGHGASALTIAEDLGGPSERLHRTTAAEHDGAPAAPLHLVAIEVRPDAGTPLLPRTPGLPDEAYDHDGQLTKREIRALSVCALQPTLGAALWDIGAGSGSVAIEWLRAEPGATAVALDWRADRLARVIENARLLGVPDRLATVAGRAPDALGALGDPPDAIFVGGGASVPGVLDTCWATLRPGGRLVVNAVTLEAEQAVLTARAEYGGRLVRIQLAHADPVGRFTAFRPQMPITQWSATKEHLVP
ncbi:precorrin-6y C5,15-methyltransferase (decarboxylating) subunit CbiE [Paraconexibacter sp.]|uniref:precorrin-6y C5,15-methyltransferase (decarboxylating) subunit CbiE n=1 Tax=Paraconexibacter sp. TaxID=2949640 RepID=UPI003564B9B4